MSKSISALKRLNTLTPGFLAFLGYYELLSFLRLPVKFTVERVTVSFRVQSPLLGGLEIDLLAYVVATSVIAYMENERKYKILHLVAAIASISALSLSRQLGVAPLAYIALGLGSFFTMILSVRDRDFGRLLPGVLVSITFMEIAALLAMSTYYMFGEWMPLLFYVVLRERVVWAPLEWGAIPLLMFVVWSGFINIIRGRPLLKPFKDRLVKASTEGIDPQLLVVLALSMIGISIVLTHLPAVNPEFEPVSVDTISYGAFFEEVEADGLTEAISTKRSRPLYLLFLYYAWIASARNTMLLMDIIHPIVALTLLIAASFYAGRKLHSWRVAGFNAVLIPLGYVLPVFFAGGYQANSLALTTALLSLTIDAEKRAGLAKLTLLMTLTALLHPWTHLMYAAALIAYRYRERKRLIYSTFAVAASYLLSRLAASCFSSAIHVSALTSIPLFEYLGFHLFGSLFEAIQFRIWNTMSNPVYISSSILAVDMLTSSILGVAAPLTLVLPANLLSRLVLNIPLQIQVSRALADFPGRYQVLILLVLAVRVLGNLSGLTPLDTSSLAYM